MQLILMKMMKSDYDKWFVSKDAAPFPAIKCKRERLIDALREAVGPVRAAKLLPSFRPATFAEHCRLELELLEN